MTARPAPPPARAAARGLLVALLVAALTACAGGDGRTTPTGAGATEKASTPAATPPAPAATATASGEGGGSSPAPGTGDRALQPPAEEEPRLPPFGEVGQIATVEPRGGPLTVVAARAARQEGFDRVVLELAGKQSGAPGWRVEHVEEARQQGSGDRVQVDGEAVLQVLVSGVGYPFDTGQEEETDDLRPTGTRVVREVVMGSTFEGQFEVFVGLSARRPFRVFRLSDPARVVVDVQH